MDINGYYINISRTKGEPYEQYLDRCIFIGNNIDNHSYTMKHLEKCSRIFVYMKWRGCRYDESLENGIMQMAKKANIVFDI